MANDRSMHPCFNRKVRHHYGRLHLPVAPKCNIQCHFCNRKFDCVNESRPGVTSQILSPGQALAYVDKYLAINSMISTIGIAGPGDPLANPAETLQTIRLIRAKYPELLFCLSSNGLQLTPYIPELAEIGVTHITVTMNAIDPGIGAEIYAWVRDGKVIYRGRDGAALLAERQQTAIRELKRYGISVKVNTIIIPGVNDGHTVEIAKKVAELGADVLNCMALFPAAGSQFENLSAPDDAMLQSIRQAAAVYIPQMTHCARCRADAAGLLGAEPDRASFKLLEEAVSLSLNPDQKRPYLAVATMEGLLVNQHLGEATQLHILEMGPDGPALHEVRSTPAPGGGPERWQEMAKILGDCHTLLVSGIGETPSRILTDSGIKIYETEGLIDQVMATLGHGGSVRKKALIAKCGLSCKGNGLGCG